MDNASRLATYARMELLGKSSTATTQKVVDTAAQNAVDHERARVLLRELHVGGVDLPLNLVESLRLNESLEGCCDGSADDKTFERLRTWISNAPWELRKVKRPAAALSVVAQVIGASSNEALVHEVAAKLAEPCVRLSCSKSFLVPPLQRRLYLKDARAALKAAEACGREHLREAYPTVNGRITARYAKGNEPRAPVRITVTADAQEWAPPVPTSAEAAERERLVVQALEQAVDAALLCLRPVIARVALPAGVTPGQVVGKGGRNISRFLANVSRALWGEEASRGKPACIELELSRSAVSVIVLLLDRMGGGREGAQAAHEAVGATLATTTEQHIRQLKFQLDQSRFNAQERAWLRLQCEGTRATLSEPCWVKQRDWIKERHEAKRAREKRRDGRRRGGHRTLKATPRTAPCRPRRRPANARGASFRERVRLHACADGSIADRWGPWHQLE